jgi:hypothetical protein
MAVTLMLHLFSKPGIELREGEDVTPEELRSLGDDLRARLHDAAGIVEKLLASGWQAEMTLYDILFSHPYITTATQAEEKLHDLGIDPDKLHVDDWEAEGDEPPME